jgi:hypothetical protein
VTFSIQRSEKQSDLAPNRRFGHLPTNQVVP